MKWVLWALAFLFLGLTSCVTNPYFILKNHHFDTSETRGEKFKFTASLSAYQDVTTAVATVTASSPNPELERWELVRNEDHANEDVNTVGGLDHTSVLLSLSLHEHFDLSVDLPAGDQPTFLTAKYQFIGLPRTQSEAGTFSGAAFAGVGLIANGADDLSLMGGATDRVDIIGQALRAGISLGVRTNPELLIYWSNSVTQFFTEMDFEREITGSRNKETFQLDGHQFLSMLGAQYIFEERVSLNLEYGYVLANTDETSQEAFTSFGLNLGYIF